jgi:predicted transcriptional regulator
MNSICVRVPASLKRELEKLSRQQKRPLSEIIREALGRRVAEENSRLENDPRFLARIALAKQSLLEGKGTRLEDVT